LFERLPDPGNVPVTENTEASREKWLFLAIPRDLLIFQKLDDGLSCR
jgi:hypothetical protein